MRLICSSSTMRTCSWDTSTTSVALVLGDMPEGGGQLPSREASHCTRERRGSQRCGLRVVVAAPRPHPSGPGQVSTQTSRVGALKPPGGPRRLGAVTGVCSRSEWCFDIFILCLGSSRVRYVNFVRKLVSKLRRASPAQVVKVEVKSRYSAPQSVKVTLEEAVTSHARFLGLTPTLSRQPTSPSHDHLSDR